MKAYIDKKKCSSDNRICKPLKECPSKAISWVEDEEEPFGSRMEINHEKCTGYLILQRYLPGSIQESMSYPDNV